MRTILIFKGTNSLAMFTSPPDGLVLTNISAGGYSLMAVAMGNDALTTTSSVVNIIVDADTDGDGLGDYQEYLYGTNPNVSDGFWIWTSSPNGFFSVP